MTNPRQGERQSSWFVAPRRRRRSVHEQRIVGQSLKPYITVRKANGAITFRRQRTPIDASLQRLWNSKAVMLTHSNRWTNSAQHSPNESRPRLRRPPAVRFRFRGASSTRRGAKPLIAKRSNFTGRESKTACCNRPRNRRMLCRTPCHRKISEESRGRDARGCPQFRRSRPRKRLRTA